MDRKAITSASVAAIGYDSGTQTLEVEFVKGSVYQYYGMPKHMYEEVMRAASKGGFVNTYIRNSYPYSRVG